MRFLHYNLQLKADDVVKVELDGQANVQLMDYSNFCNYKNGKSYRYYGGLQKVSPARIAPPYQGNWYLCIDLGGYAGTVHASVAVEKNC
jgi:hypothetical protein